MGQLIISDSLGPSDCACQRIAHRRSRRHSADHREGRDLGTTSGPKASGMRTVDSAEVLASADQARRSWCSDHFDPRRPGEPEIDRGNLRQRIGTYTNIIISVTDGKGRRRCRRSRSPVKAVAHQPPTISGTPPTSVQDGSAYAFTPTAKDPEGNPLTFSIRNKPAWAAFSTTTASCPARRAARRPARTRTSRSR